jgi:serine phosphatase RsbU (regulator of sigma subunit)
MEVSKDLRVSFPPLGIMPSLNVIDRSMTKSELGFKDHYEMNEWVLMGQGDILLLHTDGLSEHGGKDEPYFPGRLERTLRDVHQRSAKGIFDAIIEDLRAYSAPSDDISIVVIKRT